MSAISASARRACAISFSGCSGSRTTSSRIAPWCPRTFSSGCQTVGTDIVSLTDYEEHLANKTQFLLDAVLGLINTKQNDIFTVLTVVSVVGIPPTLVASIYGMNFKFMPELTWTYGYYWGLGLIALSTIVPLLWFKWRGWF